MSETPISSQEIADQLPLGLGYEKLIVPDKWEGWVPVYRTPDSATYLVPMKSDATGHRSIQALQADGVPCHLLPSGADQYTGRESQFAREVLEQPPTEVRAPFAPRLREKEALVFDPTSAKSVLDVMIATGHDSRDIRKARHDALHGELNPIVDTMKHVLELGALADDYDARANALGKAYGFQNYSMSSIDSINSLVEKGLEAFPLQRVQQRMAAGVDPETVKASVTDPEMLQSAAAEGWEEMIAFAQTHNADVYGNGIYTELHKMGDVLVALPAIASTAWTSRAGMGYVDVTSGHTLAEIYDVVEADRRNLSPDVSTFLDNSTLLKLSRKLGLLANGPSTLQRRCYTTFDEAGSPVIHLREQDYYNRRNGKMTSEAIMAALSGQGIDTDLVDDKGAVVRTGAEFDGPITVDIKELEGHEMPRFPGDRPIACVTSLDIGDQAAVTWMYGYAANHETLFKKANSETDEEGGIVVRFKDGQTVQLRTTYVGHEDEIEGKQQFILWSFQGERAVIDAHGGELKTMMKKANRAIGTRMAAVWDVSPDELYAETWLKDTVTGEYASFYLE